MADPQEIYKEVFEKILLSRGVSNQLEIEKANCTTVLETDEKDFLELPNQLQLFINQIFDGGKIVVKKISLTKYLAIVKIEVCENSNLVESKNKNLLIPISYDSKYLAFGKVLIFDFKKSMLRKPCVKKEDEKTKLGWEFISIPQNVVADFAKLLAIIDLAPYSKISIYRSGEPVSPDSFKTFSRRPKRFRRRFLRKRYRL